MNPPRALEGTVLGAYEVGERIGRGGMGEVYLARDVRLERPVALKVLPERFAENERFRERLLRESRLAASLDHPNVVPVYDAGETDGRLFIAMRYVDGPDLKAVLRDNGPLAPGRAVAIAGQSRRHSTPRTSAAWCIATSSRATCCSTSRATAITRTSRTLGSRAAAAAGPPTDSSWARSTTSRPSRSAATTSMAAPTSTRSAACFSSASRARCPFARARGWPRSSPTSRSRPRRKRAQHALPPRWTPCRRAMAKEPAERFDSCRELTRPRTTRSGSPLRRGAGRAGFSGARARACRRCGRPLAMR